MIQEILLKRVKNVTRIIYSSAIAHPLAARSQQTVTETAAQLVAQLQQGCQEQAFELTQLLSLPLPATVLPELKIWATDSGLVQIELSDPAIAAWLNSLLDTPLSLTVGTRSVLNQQQATLSNREKRIFTIQHAHARCCSLLRLADREGMIQLRSPLIAACTWPLQAPIAIPWLDTNAELQLQGAVERRLISQLFTVVDELTPQTKSLSHRQIVRLAEEVSQAFDAFHREYPLLAPSHQSTQEVVHARLGLVLVTQRVLHWLLQEGLDRCAPQEL